MTMSAAPRCTAWKNFNVVDAAGPQRPRQFAGVRVGERQVAAAAVVLPWGLDPHAELGRPRLDQFAEERRLLQRLLPDGWDAGLGDYGSIATSEIERDAYARGANGFLHKPTPLSAVAALVTKLAATGEPERRAAC